MVSAANQDLQSFQVIVAPYLCIKGAADAIAFFRDALGATEVSRMVAPDGRVSHAEIRIGGVALYLADEFPEIAVVSPKTLGGSPVLHLTVPNVDELASRAIAAGATVLRPLADQDYGYRNYKLADPFGHTW
ncbi:MAG: VOC family protein, partial [Ktedonobacterales bacterium]